MLRCINDGVTAIKPGHQLETAGNACVIWWDESSPFMLFPASATVFILESSRSGLPGSSSETQHGKVLWRFVAAISSYSVGPIITLHGRITAREYIDTQLE
jgi:hypothetical protein